MIEVIDQDREARKIYCASGFGEKSQWFKNIVANENVLVDFKGVEYRAIARVVNANEAREIVLRSAGSHPKAMKGVARLSGYEMVGTEDDIIEFSGIVRIIEFALLENA